MITIGILLIFMSLLTVYIFTLPTGYLKKAGVFTGNIPRVYLSGAISGNEDAAAEFEAAEALVLSAGYKIVNPLKISIGYKKYQQHMRSDINVLLCCDMIYYVNDIAGSKGAKVEHDVAEICGIKEVKYDEIQNCIRAIG
jgi:hypothetical protein